MANPRDPIDSKPLRIAGRVILGRQIYDDNCESLTNPVAFSNPAGTDVEYVRSLIHLDDEIPLFGALVKASQLLSGLEPNGSVVRELRAFYERIKSAKEPEAFRIILVPDFDCVARRFAERVAITDAEDIGHFEFESKDRGILVIELKPAIKKIMEGVGNEASVFLS